MHTTPPKSTYLFCSQIFPLQFNLAPIHYTNECTKNSTGEETWIFFHVNWLTDFYALENTRRRVSSISNARMTRLNFATTAIHYVAVRTIESLRLLSIQFSFEMSFDSHLFRIAIRSTNTNTCAVRYSVSEMSMSELVDTMIHMNFEILVLQFYTHIFKCLVLGIEIIPPTSKSMCTSFVVVNIAWMLSPANFIIDIGNHRIHSQSDRLMWSQNIPFIENVHCRGKERRHKERNRKRIILMICFSCSNLDISKRI